MKDPIINYVQKYWQLLSKRPEFRTVLDDNPDFAFDMINSKPLMIKEKEKAYMSFCNSCESTDRWEITRVTCSCGRTEFLNR